MGDSDLSVIRKVLAHDLMQVYVRLVLLLTVVWFSVETFAPFLALMLWSVILAVSLYPLNLWLSARLHLSEGKAAIVFIVIAVLLVGSPTIALGVSLADHVRGWLALLNEQAFQIPEANPAVADWPVVGPSLFDLWTRAHEDLMSAARMIQPQLIAGGRVVLGAAANTLLALVLFFVALLLAGFMMAHATRGTDLTRQLLGTFTSHQRGDEIQTLVVATIRSVSNGVVGVAFLQALALGVGFLALDVPAAGVLALLVLFLGVLQLPSSLVVLPVLAWVWLSSGGGALANALGTIYLVVAGLADGLLKPYLLGKGVDTPMPVVLIGALGGMAAEGLIGLFVGAVMLSVGYKLLMSWVEHSVAEHEALEHPSENTDP
jgi:predicted PurR-regulated permease PerM